MSGPKLSRRALNRALLDRQCLLTRSVGGAAAVIEQVAGLQAQVVSPPFIGLWARQEGFSLAATRAALTGREAVRATLMRSTLQLVASSDYAWLRPALQPALAQALRSFFGARQRELDIPALVAAARAFLAGQPATLGAVREALTQQHPGADPDALAYVIRTHLPMVQVADASSAWGYPSAPRYVEAEQWLEGLVLWDEGVARRELVRRYLRAFGPASVADIQRWSGLTGLKAVCEALGDELVRYEAPTGKAPLCDLAGLTLPDEDAPAPARLMPEYDNLILGHEDRSRIIDEAHKKRVFLSAARVRATILVDGFVAGAWSAERRGEEMIVHAEAFVTLDATSRGAVEEEAARLVSVWPEVAQVWVDWG